MQTFQHTKTLKNGTIKTKTYKIHYDDYNEWLQIYREITGMYFKRSTEDMNLKLSKLDAIKKRLNAIASGIEPEKPSRSSEFHFGGAL